MVLFPPPFYFDFDISILLSYIQNNFSYELARPIMGTIFLVIYICVCMYVHVCEFMYVHVCMFMYVFMCRVVPKAR